MRVNTLPENKIVPENTRLRKRSSSNHPFSGATLVSGRVPPQENLTVRPRKVARPQREKIMFFFPIIFRGELLNFRGVAPEKCFGKTGCCLLERNYQAKFPSEIHGVGCLYLGSQVLIRTVYRGIPSDIQTLEHIVDDVAFSLDFSLYVCIC